MNDKIVEKAERRLSGRCVYCSAKYDDKIGDYTHKPECNIAMLGLLSRLQNDVITMSTKLAAIPYPATDLYPGEVQEMIDCVKRLGDTMEQRHIRNKTSGGNGNPF